MNHTVIALHVTPKSSRNEIIGWVSDAGGNPMLKIRLNATPEDGKANTALIKFLAKEWGVSARTLVLEGGAASRYKRLNVGSETLCGHIRNRYRKS